MNKLMKGRNRQNITKLLCFVMLFTILTSMFPMTVSAHESVHITETIDSTAVKYSTALIEDKPGWNRESNHIESRTARFDRILGLAGLDSPDVTKADGLSTTPADGNTIKSRKVNPIFNLTLDSDSDLKRFKMLELGIDPASGQATLKGSPSVDDVAVKRNAYSIFKNVIGDGKKVPESGEGIMIFDFPSKEEGGMAFSSGKGFNEEDYNRAFSISANLTTSLNGILSIINGGQKYDDIQNMMQASIYIRPQVHGDQGGTAKYPYLYTKVPGYSDTTYWILYGTDPTKKTGYPNSDKNFNTGVSDVNIQSYIKNMQQADENGNLLVHVIKEYNGTISTKDDATFVYAMKKGYAVGSDSNKPIIANSFAFASSGDVVWLTIHHIAFQANYNYSIMNINSATAAQIKNEDVGVLDKMIAGLFRSIVSGIKSVLGLYDMSELIYNQGLRGTQLYNEGTMTADWWSIVLRYHIIFQAIAWMLVIIAVLKILIQLNLSTINPSLRMSIMEIIQKFIIVGFLLVTCIPLIRLMISINNSIVGIFATQVDVSELGTVNSGGNILVGILIQIVYLGIFIYVNFIYIMRSIMIALFTAAAPFFIVTMAFSSRGKGLFDNWLKEITANIFLQGFHAFSFAFLLNVVGASRGIEQLVTTFAIIPLTEAFRSYIFGQSGAATIGIAKQFSKATGEMAVGAVKGVGSNLLSKKTGKESSSGFNEISGLEASNGTGARESKNSQALSESANSRSSSGLKKIKDGALETAKGLAIGGAKMTGGLAESGFGMATGDNEMVYRGAYSAGHGIGTNSVRTVKGLGTMAVGSVETAGQAISALAGGIGAGAAGAGSSVGAGEMLQASNTASSITSNPSTLTNLKSYVGTGYRIRNQADGTSQMVSKNEGNGYSLRVNSSNGLSASIDLNSGNISSNVPDYLVNKQTLQGAVNEWTNSGSAESRQQLQSYMSEMGFNNFRVDSQNNKVHFDTNQNYKNINKIESISSTKDGNIQMNFSRSIGQTDKFIQTPNIGNFSQSFNAWKLNDSVKSSERNKVK